MNTEEALNLGDHEKLPEAEAEKEIVEDMGTEPRTSSENLTEERMVIEREEISASNVELKVTKRKCDFDVVKQPESKRKRDEKVPSNTEYSSVVVTEGSETIAAINSVATEIYSINESDMEDDDDILFVGDIKQHENTSKKRSASLTEIHEPVSKAKVFMLNTQVIANDLYEEMTAEKTGKVGAIVTEKDSETPSEKEPSNKVTNQDESDNQREPMSQDTPSIETAQKVSNESTETEITLTLDAPPRNPLCTSAFALNFVRKFRKNFDKMNRNDLEELLIQKCVEAIVHKSDDADMRNRIETQENKLQSYCTKYQELSQQYCNLQNAHYLLVEALESNQSVVTSVRIARSVQVQAYLLCEKVAVPEPPEATAAPTAQQENNANLSRNRRKVSSQHPNDPNPHIQQQQQIMRQNMMAKNTENKLLKQQLLQNNSPAFKAQANVTKPAAPQFSALSLNQINQNSSPETLGSAEPPRIPPVILKKMGTTRRVVTLNSSTATITRSSVTATSSTAATISNFIDLTDEEDSKQVNVASNGTNLSALVVLSNKAAAGQGKVTFTAEQNSPQMVPQNRLMQTIGNKNVAIASKKNIVLVRKQQPATTLTAIQQRQHPARPSLPYPNPTWKQIPPQPIIRINHIESGIVIYCTMDTMDEMTDKYAEVVAYQIYAYPETLAKPSSETWQHVGDVKATLLPMKITLKYFKEGQRYHFAVRAVDEHSRYGSFSLPKTWT